MMRRQRRALAALLVVSLLATPLALGESAPESLRRGSQGAQVSALQQRLAELGYLHDRIDGRYGQRTQQAVNRFQKDSGLKVSGAASADTQALLFDPETKPVTVYLAPSGKRYHARKNCRGLKLAKRVSAESFPDAEAKRTPCIICYGRLALRIAEEKRAAAEPSSDEAA